jgi:hypothetical protein
MSYDPRDYREPLNPIINGDADAVFGSRFMGGRPHRVVYFWHMVGNRLLTLLSNSSRTSTLRIWKPDIRFFDARHFTASELKKNASGSSRRLRRSWRSAAVASMKSASHIPDAPTKKARKSAGVTGFARFMPS